MAIDLSLNEILCECCKAAYDNIRRVHNFTDDGIESQIVFSAIGWHPHSEILNEIKYCPYCGKKL